MSFSEKGPPPRRLGPRRPVARQQRCQGWLPALTAAHLSFAARRRAGPRPPQGGGAAPARGCPSAGQAGATRGRPSRTRVRRKRERADSTPARHRTTQPRSGQSGVSARQTAHRVAAQRAPRRQTGGSKKGGRSRRRWKMADRPAFRATGGVRSAPKTPAVRSTRTAGALYMVHTGRASAATAIQAAAPPRGFQKKVESELAKRPAAVGRSARVCSSRMRFLWRGNRST